LTGCRRCMVEEAERFLDINTQVFDLTLWCNGGVHYPQWRMGGKADVFKFAGKGKTIEEFRFAWCEGESKVPATVEVLFSSIFQ